METFDTFVNLTTARYVNAKHEAERKRQEQEDARKKDYLGKWQKLAEDFLAGEELYFSEIKAIYASHWEEVDLQHVSDPVLQFKVGELGTLSVYIDRVDGPAPHFVVRRIEATGLVNGEVEYGARFATVDDAIACMNLLRLLNAKKAQEAQTLADIDR